MLPISQIRPIIFQTEIHTFGRTLCRCLKADNGFETIPGKISVFAKGNSKGSRSRTKVMIQNIAVKRKPIFVNISLLRKSNEIKTSNRLLTSIVINMDEKLKWIIRYTLFLLFFQIRQ